MALVALASLACRTGDRPADAAPVAPDSCASAPPVGTAREPRRLAAVPGEVRELVADLQAVYLVSSSPTGDRLLQLPREGGTCAPRQLAEGRLTELVADATHLYYLSQAEGLSRLRKDGSAPVEALGIRASSSLLVDETNLYFIRSPDVVRVNKSSLQETIVTSWAGAAVLAVDEGALYVGRETTETFLDDGTIRRVTGGIRRVPADGTPAIELTTTSVEKLAVVNAWLYFTSGPVLYRMDGRGGPITEVDTLAAPRGLRAATGYLYGFGRAYVVAYDASAPGSEPVFAIPTTREVFALFADGAGVYYTTGGDAGSSALFHIAR